MGPDGEPGIPGYRVIISNWKLKYVYLHENSYIKMSSQLCKLR